MARRNYLIEMRHILPWGIFIGMYEGAGSSIVVAKTFHGSEWLITIVMAIPTIANLMGLVWGSVAARRPKLPLFMLFGIGNVLLIGSVALTPQNEWGGWIFAGQIAVARTLLSGCVTVRSGLWKHNYPTQMRGRIAARIQIVRYSLGIGAVFFVSLLFDANPAYYVYVYPAVALIGTLGLFQLRHLRVRGEKSALQAIRTPEASSNGLGRRLVGPIVDAYQVLRDDAEYRRYCLGMMLLGTGNIMIFPVMAIMVTKELPLNYNHSTILLEVLPQFMMMVSMMAWAGLFDRRGVVRFRVLNAVTWAMASVFGGIAAAMMLLPETFDTVWMFAVAITLVALSRGFEGLGRGGGAIGWNLGHLHFAEPAKADIYMGAHVFLTGIRGLTAPFMGTFFYKTLGPGVFAISATLGFLGMLTFRSLIKGDASSAFEPAGESAFEEPLPTEPAAPELGPTISRATISSRSR